MTFTQITPRDGALVESAETLAKKMIEGLFPTTDSLGGIIGLACALLALVMIAVDFANENMSRGVLKIIALAIFIAVSKGADEFFTIVDAVVDLPANRIKKLAADAGDLFYDPASAFPLRKRYESDFSFRLPAGDPLKKVETAARRCLTEEVLLALRNGRDAVALLADFRVVDGSSAKTCSAYITEVDLALKTAREAKDFEPPSRFAMRRAIALAAWNMVNPGTAFPDPGAERDVGAQKREGAKTADPLERFGKYYGTASKGTIILSRLLFVFLLFPQYWRLFLGFMLGMFWMRSWPLGLYAAHKASEQAVSVMVSLDAVPANLSPSEAEAELGFMNSIKTYVSSAAGSDAAYAAFYTDQMTSDVPTVIIVNVITGILFAYGLLLLRAKATVGR